MPENPQTKMWFWVSVSSITIIIFILWAWATKISLASFSWKKTPEAELVEKGKKDWRAIFDAKETTRQSEQMKLQLKNILNKITTEASSSTPAATSTSNINTTTSSTVTTSSQ